MQEGKTLSVVLYGEVLHIQVGSTRFAWKYDWGAIMRMHIWLKLWISFDCLLGYNVHFRG